jgi:hypothetical protein
MGVLEISVMLAGDEVESGRNEKVYAISWDYCGFKSSKNERQNTSEL